MHDLIIITYRTILFYLIILFVLRIMGKREVGELGIIDVVVFLIMAEVAALGLDSPEKNIFEAILPIIVLLGIQLISSFISLKSKKFRDLVDGDPSTLIRDGVIMEEELRKQRYNLDDLFQQLREQKIGSVRDVTYAFLEPSGNLSVFTKDDTQPALALISDGIVQPRHLKLIGKTEEWLLDELKRQGIQDVTQIFYCSYESKQLKYQLKEAHR
ncbi:DUF421 domain-containing protein [Sporosarcina ureilytica]|uniref:YetF C-terminal domain-containing protein n=1 Tax=Sporosarcina ureilytica TaxID=298596 RepID=A0A1D8JFY7_9BACL|nr:DUF421 domain-containing protein [Sporosarcina ureilytica]AOV07627.1 hypothetical protein BI350_08825 [Sporosarcina ureilytica]